MGLEILGPADTTPAKECSEREAVADVADLGWPWVWKDPHWIGNGSFLGVRKYTPSPRQVRSYCSDR